MSAPQAQAPHLPCSAGGRQTAAPTRDRSNAGHTNGAAQLLTAEQLAERWQVKTSHVYRLTREGLLPAVQLGRYRRYRLDAIEEFERGGGSG